MLDIPFRSARQLAAGVRKKEIGCLELLDLYLTRIERYDGAVNAVVVRDFDRARRRARAATFMSSARTIGSIRGRSSTPVARRASGTDTRSPPAPSRPSA